jgi:hypothetical protein
VEGGQDSKKHLQKSVMEFAQVCPALSTVKFYFSQDPGIITKGSETAVGVLDIPRSKLYFLCYLVKIPFVSAMWTNYTATQVWICLGKDRTGFSLLRVFAFGNYYGHV